MICTATLPALAATRPAASPAVALATAPARPGAAPARSSAISALVTVSRSVTLTPRGSAHLTLPLRPTAGAAFTVAKARKVTWVVDVVRAQPTGSGAAAKGAIPATTVVRATRTVTLPAGAYTVRCTLDAARPAAGRRSVFALACGIHRGTTKVATLTGVPVHFSLSGSGRQPLTWTTSIA